MHTKPYSYFTTNLQQLWTGNILSPAPTWLGDQLKVVSFYLDLILGSSGGACNPLSHPYSPGILLPKEVPDLDHRVSLAHTHVDGKVGIHSTHLVLKSLRKDNSGMQEWAPHSLDGWIKCIVSLHTLSIMPAWLPEFKDCSGDNFVICVYYLISCGLGWTGMRDHSEQRRPIRLDHRQQQKESVQQEQLRWLWTERQKQQECRGLTRLQLQAKYKQATCNQCRYTRWMQALWDKREQVVAS